MADLKDFAEKLY